MLPEIKCTITENAKLVASLTQVTNFQHITESLNKFELALNAVLTKLINDAGDLNADCNIDDENESDGEEVQDEKGSPKKKKKN